MARFRCFNTEFGAKLMKLNLDGKSNVATRKKIAFVHLFGAEKDKEYFNTKNARLFAVA